MRTNRFSAALLAAVSSLALASAAHAQAPADEGAQIGEIVVTARQRAENLQDVPLSISAFTSEQLSARGAISLADVAALTPGLNFEAYANGGYPVLTLRGLSATTITGFESNVSTFLGGIYLPRAYMVDTGLVGIERIEVVKGPQSALYGRNAFAGAINYVPATPPKAPKLDAFVTGGNHDRFDFGVTAGGPLFTDKIRVIGGYGESKFDGTWFNQHPNRDRDAGGTTGLMGGWHNKAGFVAAEINPIEALTINLGWNHTERNTEAQGRYNISRNTGQANCSLVGGVLQFYCGELPLLPAIVDPRSTGLKARSDIYRAGADYRLTSTLTASYLFGHIRSNAYSYDQSSINSISGDTAAGVQFLGLPIGVIKGDSHDFKLSFDNGATRAAVGGFISDLTDDYRTTLINRPPLGTDPITPDLLPQTNAQNGVTDVKNRSIFGQASHDFLDGALNISLEGRYTEETKILADRLTNATFRAKFKNFTPRAVAQYNLSEDSNVYVSAAKGVKSGGFNSGNIFATERAFTPEQNWTYELGTKNRFFNRRVQFNADIFYVDWSDLQTLSVSGNPGFIGTVTRNVGSATAKGVEVELQAQLVRGLQVGGSFTYTDSKYGDGMIDPRFLLMRTAAGAPILICDNVTCPSNGSIGGNPLPRQSKYQASASIQYRTRFDFLGGTDFSIGGDISYKSKQFQDPLVLTWAPDRTLVNINAGFTHDHVSLELFAKNLFDKKYVASATYNLAGNVNVRYEGVLGERRTFGATLRYRY